MNEETRDAASSGALRIWESAFDSILDPVAIVDADGGVRGANQAFRRLFARGSAEVLNAPIGSLLYGKGGESRDEFRAGHVTYETSELRIPGTYLLSHSPVGLADGTGLVVHLTDLTALRAAEEAALQSQEQARQAQKMEAVGRLAGGIAHDFNNLLTAVLCSSEVLIERLPRDAQVLEPLEQIQKAAERGAALVRHLLSFSRPRPGLPEVIEIDDSIGSLGKIIASLVGEDIRLELRLGAPGARVRIDAVQLEQVLLNLAVNARDAMTSRGTLTFTTELAPAADGGSALVLSVTDTGSGMDEATRAHAFDPFFTTKPEGRGTGLGLTNVYAIVERAGGEITVESAPERGTTVRIRLPAAGGIPRVVSAEAGTASLARRHEGKTVLLVEDEAAPREAIADALGELGYRVLAASHAAEALDVARKHRGDIAVLLADVVMPGASGPDLAREIRAAYPKARVLLMSGYSSDAMSERTTEEPAGAASFPFLAKPFNLTDLARRLEEVLEE